MERYKRGLSMLTRIPVGNLNNEEKRIEKEWDETVSTFRRDRQQMIDGSHWSRWDGTISKSGSFQNSALF